MVDGSGCIECYVSLQLGNKVGMDAIWIVEPQPIGQDDDVAPRGKGQRVIAIAAPVAYRRLFVQRGARIAEAGRARRVDQDWECSCDLPV